MTEQEFENVRQKAELGDNYYELELAQCYCNGQFVEKDMNQAYAWFVKSSNHGNSIGTANIGWFYEFGHGDIEVDLKKACYYYIKAFTQKNEKERENWDWFYDRLSVVKDSIDLSLLSEDELIIFFEDLLESGFGGSGNSRLKKILNKKTIFELCLSLSEKGYGKADYQMYYFYKDGCEEIGLEKDIDKAFEYLVKNASSESPLGIVLSEIIKDHEDKCSPEEFVNYIVLLYVQGETKYEKQDAAFKLYRIYRQGKGNVGQNDEKAMFWLLESRKLGLKHNDSRFDVDDYLFLGNCHMNGLMVEKSIYQACRYYEKANSEVSSYDSRKTEIQELFEETKRKIDSRFS